MIDELNIKKHFLGVESAKGYFPFDYAKTKL